MIGGLAPDCALWLNFQTNTGTRFHDSLEKRKRLIGYIVIIEWTTIADGCQSAFKSLWWQCIDGQIKRALCLIAREIDGRYQNRVKRILKGILLRYNEEPLTCRIRCRCIAFFINPYGHGGIYINDPAEHWFVDVGNAITGRYATV